MTVPCTTTGAPATGAVADFAAEIGSVDPVTCVGGRSQWDVGGVADARAREVRAPAGIVTFTPAEMTVRVRAGTRVTDLAAALAEGGQTVALPAWTGATVGGVLAVGHSGIRRLGWGPVRDTVLEAVMVSAEGAVVKTGGPTVKNVSGYDLPRLLVGSLGTIGLLAETVLRTRPWPSVSQWLAGPGDPFVVRDRLFRPSAILWDGTTTWVLLDGHEGDVRAEAAALAALGFAALDREPPVPRYRWSCRPGDLARLDPSVHGPFLAEIGVGTVHRPTPGPIPGVPVPPVPPEVRALTARVKQVFDPTGRLNPGRAVLR